MDIFREVTDDIREKFRPLAENVASELAIGKDKQVIYILQQSLGQAYLTGKDDGKKEVQGEG